MTVSQLQPALIEAFTRKVNVAYFHGGPDRENFDGQKFDRDQHEDKNAQGPGIYLTSSQEDARTYRGLSGSIHAVKVNGARTYRSDAKPSRAFLEKLIDYAPDEARETGLSNWDENPNVAKQRALQSYMQEEALSAAVAIYHDFYGATNATAFAAANVKAGVDAVEVPKNLGVTHLVVYNPRVLHVTRRFKEVGETMHGATTEGAESIGKLGWPDVKVLTADGAKLVRQFVKAGLSKNRLTQDALVTAIRASKLSRAGAKGAIKDIFKKGYFPFADYSAEIEAMIDQAFDRLSEEANGGSHMVKHYFDFDKMPGGMQASTGKHTDDARKVTNHPVITRIAAKLRLLWNKLNNTPSRKERMAIIRSAMGGDARYMKNESEIGDDAALFEAGKKGVSDYAGLRERTIVKPVGDGVSHVVIYGFDAGYVSNISAADAEAYGETPGSKLNKAGWMAALGHGKDKRVVAQGLKSREEAVEAVIRASMKERKGVSEAGAAGDDEADPANPDKNPQGAAEEPADDFGPDGEPEPPAPKDNFGPAPQAPDASQSNYKAPKGKRDSGAAHDDERLKHGNSVQKQAAKIDQRGTRRDYSHTQETVSATVGGFIGDADVQKVRAQQARKGRPKLLVPGSKRKASLESVSEGYFDKFKEIQGVTPLPGLKYMADGGKSAFNVAIFYEKAGEGQNPAILTLTAPVSAGLDGKLARQVVAEIANRTLKGVDWTKSPEEIGDAFRPARAAWILAFTMKPATSPLVMVPTKATLDQLPSKYPANLFA